MTKEQQWNKIIEKIKEDIRLLELHLETTEKQKELDMARQLQKEQYLGEE